MQAQRVLQGVNRAHSEQRSTDISFSVLRTLILQRGIILIVRKKTDCSSFLLVYPLQCDHLLLQENISKAEIGS